MSADSQRQQALAELEGRLGETQEQAAWYTHKHQAAVKRVDQLKVGSPCSYLSPPLLWPTPLPSSIPSLSPPFCTLPLSRNTHKHQAAVKLVDQLKVIHHNPSLLSPSSPPPPPSSPPPSSSLSSPVPSLLSSYSVQPESLLAGHLCLLPAVDERSTLVECSQTRFAHPLLLSPTFCTVPLSWYNHKL